MDILENPVPCRFDAEKVRDTIQKISEEIGFDLVGVAEVKSEEGREKSEKLDEWVENGYCAEMKWFAETVEKRKDILKVMPDAKSVICVAMNYCSDTNIRMHANDTNNTNGRIARYARGRDYHKIFNKKLKLFSQRLKEVFPEGEFKYYSDTGPVLERAWAVQAGLGFVGKNTNLITKYGSWVLLGEIITNVEIPNSNFKLPTSATCGSCRRCLDACPTGALCAPYTVDARKCISYLTIEYEGEIPMELREKMGNRIFGCDACQEVCPFNIGRQTEGINFKTESSLLVRYSGLVGNDKNIGKGGETEYGLKEILSIKTDEEFLEKFAGSPLMRAKRRGLVRNACVAAGNSGDKSLLPYLKECLNDNDTIISEAARWAVEKLKKEI